MHTTLSFIPEELLERILELVISPGPSEPTHRPSWHPYAPASRPYSKSHASPIAPSPVLNRVSPLLVCRAWLRIATPLQYRHIALRTPRQTVLLANTLRRNPQFGLWVRSLRVEGTFAALGDVSCMCPNIEFFDLTVDNGVPYSPPVANADVMQAAEATIIRFCEGFGRLRKIKHLIIRKTAYLTQPRPSLIFDYLSRAIYKWRDLESVNITFRFSHTPSSANFAASLAAAPKLRMVRAALPAVWNSTLLEISANPALQRIELAPDTELLGAHLFLAEARKHPRLLELIRAGTPLMRARAHTTTVDLRFGPVVETGQRAAQCERSAKPSGSAPTRRVDPRTGIPLSNAPNSSRAYMPGPRGVPPARRMSAV
ncbi:hypothetical protein CERSUDRAFT_115454 [Gelatoporia subvermispora B]|uniref:F-box domain-containing protein n=1 Tax=Ceriporiopsis subvermispora (strain B) TaxID=914234 RepID=M2QHF1_CERS8|nr:hypothetical protein CERSUDRAFT_115454 [Gelatoporia subvermispora B]